MTNTFAISIPETVCAVGLHAVVRRFPAALTSLHAYALATASALAHLPECFERGCVAEHAGAAPPMHTV